MSWLEKIRNKPHEEKVRLIWIIAGCSAVVLIVLWIFTSRIASHSQKDTTLFKSLGQGVKDVRDNYKK